MENEKREAKKKYLDSQKMYVKEMLGRPMEKLNVRTLSLCLDLLAKTHLGSLTLDFCLIHVEGETLSMTVPFARGGGSDGRGGGGGRTSTVPNTEFPATLVNAHTSTNLFVLLFQWLVFSLLLGILSFYTMSKVYCII